MSGWNNEGRSKDDDGPGRKGRVEWLTPTKIEPVVGHMNNEEVMGVSP